MIAAFGLFCVTICGSLQAGVQPRQEYAHAAYSTSKGGTGGDEYWIFTPEEPRPAEAPVVVLLHGWGGMDPFSYGAWILHLVRRGNIVVFPRYQANIKTKFHEMTPAAVRGVQAAYKRLQEVGPVRPAPDKMAFVGHSMGGFIATNLAALAKNNDLPSPSALMVNLPGDGDGRMRRLGRRLELVDMSSVPESTLVLLVTGDEDSVVGDRGAEKIWTALSQSPAVVREYITFGIDKKRQAKLVADHLSPLATDESFDPDFSLYRSKDAQADLGGKNQGLLAKWRENREHRGIERRRNRRAKHYAPDAMDYNGYWPLLDDLLEVAFASGGSETKSAVMKNSIDRYESSADANRPRIIRRSTVKNSIP